MKFTLGLLALAVVSAEEWNPAHSHLKDPKYNIDEFSKQLKKNVHSKAQVKSHKKEDKKTKKTKAAKKQKHAKKVESEGSEDDETLIDVMPIAIPFHSDVPISKAYQKLIDDQEKEAEKYRKAYNEA